MKSSGTEFVGIFIFSTFSNFVCPDFPLRCRRPFPGDRGVPWDQRENKNLRLPKNKTFSVYVFVRLEFILLSG